MEEHLGIRTDPSYPYDYVKRLGPGEAMESHWVSTGIFAAAHDGDPAHGALVGHFGCPAVQETLTPPFRAFLAEARKTFGNRLHLVIRGAAAYSRWNDRLYAHQEQARETIEQELQALGIPIDCDWTPDDAQVQFTFDADRGVMEEEDMRMTTEHQDPETVLTGAAWRNQLLAERVISLMEVLEDVALLSEDEEHPSAVRSRMAKKYRSLIGIHPQYRQNFHEVLERIRSNGSMSPAEAAAMFETR